MPKWMHNRAEHILAKNPSMPKSEAFAIATQQMEAVGKGPKGYGTPEGHAKAKEKYPTPSDDKKTANPGHLESPKMRRDEEAYTKGDSEKSAESTLGSGADPGALEKRSGVLRDVWEAANTPIAGTPKLIAGRHLFGDAASTGSAVAKKVAPKQKTLADVYAARRAAYQPKTASVMIEELNKLGAISDEQARRSLDRLDSLEQNKPTAGQVGRYAALGAMAGPVGKGIANVIKGRQFTNYSQHGTGVRGALRGIAGEAVGGAIAAGAVPLIRNHTDRTAEMGTLKKYVKQYHEQPESKVAFTQSQYGDTGGFVDFHQVSGLPNRPAPSLKSPLARTPDSMAGVKAASFLTEEEMAIKISADYNVGKWWEEVGGPFLAKGGDPSKLKKMMDEAGLPEHIQKKFERVAKERYKDGTTSAARAARQEPWTPKSGPPTAEERANAKAYDEAKGRAGSFNAPSGLRDAMGMLAGLAGAAYMGSDLLKGKDKPGRMKEKDQGKARTAYVGGSVLSGVHAGSSIGGLFGGRNSAVEAVGALVGGVLAGTLGNAAFNKQLEINKSEKLNKTNIKKITDEASMSGPAIARTHLPLLALGQGVRLALGAPPDPQSIGTSLASSALSGYGLKYLNDNRYNEMKKKLKAKGELQKAAGVMSQGGQTPAAMLASSRHVAQPKVTEPSGPSIGDIAKPHGFGHKIPGATK